MLQLTVFPLPSILLLTLSTSLPILQMLVTVDLVETEKYIGVKWLRGLLYCCILQKGIQIRANLILKGTKKKLFKSIIYSLTIWWINTLDSNIALHILQTQIQSCVSPMPDCPWSEQEFGICVECEGKQSYKACGLLTCITTEIRPDQKPRTCKQWPQLQYNFFPVPFWNIFSKSST